MRALFPAVLLALALAQEVYHPTATLVRKGKEVVVEKTSPDEQGLAWIEEREKGVLFVFYDPPPYAVRVRFGKDAEARGHLAVVEQPNEGKASIRLGNGEARYDPEADRAVYTVKAEKNAVEIKTGRFTAKGALLDYDNDRGLAALKGPVRFTREGKTPLTGAADRLVYAVDEARVWLTGHVVFQQDGRTTRAERALVDDKAGLAWLWGEPVVSEKDGERIQGRRLRYGLKSGAIWVLEGVAGALSDD